MTAAMVPFLIYPALAVMGASACALSFLLVDGPVFTRAAVADLRTALASHPHRKPSALARLFRDLWTRPGQAEPSCRACSDADEGACTCTAECHHVRCTGGFR